MRKILFCASITIVILQGMNHAQEEQGGGAFSDLADPVVSGPGVLVDTLSVGSGPGVLVDTLGNVQQDTIPRGPLASYTPSLPDVAQEHSKILQKWQSPETQNRLREVVETRARNVALPDVVPEEKPRSFQIPDYPESEYFYYVASKKIPLTPSEDELIIRFKGGTPFDSKREVLENRGLVQWGITTPRYDFLKRTDTQDSIFAHIEQIIDKPTVHFSAPFFYTPEQRPVIPTDEILVKFIEEITPQQIEEIHARYQTETLRVSSGEVYVLKLNTKSGINTLRTTTQLYEEPLVQWAEPNFIIFLELLNETAIPEDPLFSYQEGYWLHQWNLHDLGHPASIGIGNLDTDNDIDAPEAWTITRGSATLKVAVIDVGIELDHEDLIDNTSGVSHYDVSDPAISGPKPIPIGSPNMDSLAVYKGNAHGTQVAGVLAAAQNNDKGMSGVAPGVKIVSVRIGSRTVGSVILSHPDIFGDAIFRAIDSAGVKVNVTS